MQKQLMYEAEVSENTNLLMNAILNVDIPLQEGMETDYEKQKEEKESMWPAWKMMLVLN